MIRQGDCRVLMAAMDEASVDAIVCDPPYGLNFMGKEWDRQGVEIPSGIAVSGTGVDFKAGANGRAHSHGLATNDNAKFGEWSRLWAIEALRVLKPGGHLVAFGGTRTYHRLTCALEDAGFEIRDCLMWLYGQGFPKSLSPFRSIMSSLCPSHGSAPHAVRVSELIPLELPEAKRPIALGLALIQPEGAAALLIRIGGEEDLDAVMVTSSSAYQSAAMTLNIESSWLENWGGSSSEANTFITETVSRMTIDPRTLKFCQSLSTQDTTTRGVLRPSGCECLVGAAVERSNDGEVSTIVTPMLIVRDGATSKLNALKPLGSALKPSFEPIILARKPLIGTVATNVLEHGTGAVNIDGCRVESAKPVQQACSITGFGRGPGMGKRDRNYVLGTGAKFSDRGRWPANLVLSHSVECVEVGTKRVKNTSGSISGDEISKPATGDAVYAERERVAFSKHGDADGLETVEAWECVEGCPIKMLDAQSGIQKDGVAVQRNRDGEVHNKILGAYRKPAHSDVGFGGSGGASRFFYCAKASKKDRGEGNTHPTVKPNALMRWLVRLVTPPGGLVLDPFCGSGSTGVAAREEGFEFLGLEQDPSYVEIARKRVGEVE